MPSPGENAGAVGNRPEPPPAARSGNRIVRMVRKNLFSPSYVTAFLFGITGLGFSGANLILAEVYRNNRIDYAQLTLIVAVLNTVIPFAPLGVTGIINRRLLHPDARIIKLSLWTSLSVGVVTAAISSLVYGLAPIMAGLILAGIVGGGVTVVAAAYFQRFHLFVRSVFLESSGNLVFLVASIVVLVCGYREIWFPIAIIVLGSFLTAAWGWRSACQRLPRDGPSIGRFPWREALSFAGIGIIAPLFIQLERLLIPKVRPLDCALLDLASFGVLAAVVVAPYRMLQMGMTFTVLPRMRKIESVAGRRRFFLRETLGLIALVAAGSVALYVLAPLVFSAYYPEYNITLSQVVAAIVTGSLRALAGVLKGTALALSSTRSLVKLNVLSWVAIGVAVAGAAFGARWGLSGVMYGVGVGWVFLLIAYSCAMAPHLRAGAPVTVPSEIPPGE